MEALSFKGRYIIKIKEGKNTFTIDIGNIVVDCGLTAIMNKLGDGELSSLFQYIALGTNNTAPIPGDILLISEVFRKAPLTVSSLDNVVTVKSVLDFDEANNHTFREIGVFGVDASGALNTGTLISRAVLPDTPKVSGQIVDITFELTSYRH